MRRALEQLRPAMNALATLLEQSGDEAPVSVLSLEVDWTRLRRLDFQEAKSARDLALRELVPLGVEGAIVGKALYAGAFTLAEALDVAAG